MHLQTCARLERVLNMHACSLFDGAHMEFKSTLSTS